MTKQENLFGYVFDGQPHPLSGELLEWLQASARFTAFVETYRDKIRKKIRLAHNPESALDLRSELEVAYRLLSDRRLAVAYEPYASQGRRSPDFAVTYRANLDFNLEVARMRAEEGGTGTDERFLRILLYKLGQMRPGMSNLLVIYAWEGAARALDLERLMQAIKIRAETRDPAFYAINPYEKPADFYKDFLHLSGILLCADGVQAWANKQARPDLPENVLRLVRSRLAGASAG